MNTRKSTRKRKSVKLYEPQTPLRDQSSPRWKKTSRRSEGNKSNVIKTTPSKPDEKPIKSKSTKLTQSTAPLFDLMEKLRSQYSDKSRTMSMDTCVTY